MLAQWFWKEDFKNFVNVFSLFGNYIPLEKDVALHLNQLEIGFQLRWAYTRKTKIGFSLLGLSFQKIDKTKMLYKYVIKSNTC